MLTDEDGLLKNSLALAFGNSEPTKDSTERTKTPQRCACTQNEEARSTSSYDSTLFFAGPKESWECAQMICFMPGFYYGQYKAPKKQSECGKIS